MRRTVPALISLILFACGSNSENPSSTSTPPAATASGGASPASPSSGGATSSASTGGTASVAAGSGSPSTGGAATPSNSGGSPATSSGGTSTGGAAGSSGSAAGGQAPTNGGVGGAAGAPNGGNPATAGVAGVAGAGGAPIAEPPLAGGNGSLKDKFQNYFPIGAAVDANGPTTHGELLSKHFNSVTPENEMKFASLQPTEGQFSYGPADRIVQYAAQNAMKIRGHALVWHSQNPDWLWQGPGGGSVSKQTLLARMKAHIDAVAKHFRGKVYCWDVVNEAVMNDGHLRGPNEPDGQQSRWLEIIGEEYIAEAFRYAHDADPDAKLFYNDFYNYIPEKQQAIYELMKKLLEAGVPVHGVGLQAHLNIEPSTDPTNQAYHQHVQNLEKAIELYSSLGLEVQITEMDLSLYIPGVTYTEDTFYTAATFTAELKAKQAARYQAFFEMFRRHHRELSGVTLWGIADDNTWLSEFASMRKDFPLLFDDRHMTKPAYDAVMDW